MGKAHSVDLRGRVYAAIVGGGSWRAEARRFGVHLVVRDTDNRLPCDDSIWRLREGFMPVHEQRCSHQQRYDNLHTSSPRYSKPYDARR